MKIIKCSLNVVRKCSYRKLTDSCLLLSDILTATNSLLKALLILFFSFKELNATSERTDYVGMAPSFFNYPLKTTTSVEACYNEGLKKSTLRFVTVFTQYTGECLIVYIFSSWYFKLVALRETHGVLLVNKNYTTSVAKMDPAVSIYWILDKVSKHLLGSSFSSR